MEDMHQLHIFRTLAQNLSFTRTAEILFLTQSAVSHQIAKLERELGTPLFHRSGRTVSLTTAGATLLKHSRQVLAALEEAEAAVRQSARPDLGRLRIGASVNACQYIIPEALREFRESFPGYSLSITPGDTPAITELLAEGTIDLAIMLRVDRRSNLRYHDLFTDDLGFLVSPLHPWAKAGRADRKELAAQHLVVYSRNSATFRMIERYFVRQQVPLRDWIELGSTEAIKELVKLGLGISITASWISRPEIKSRSLVWLPLPGMRLKRTWCVASQAAKELSVAEQTFIGLCKAVAADLDAGAG
jgi:DNA-binding transcriptional LysR family regulator